MDEILTEIRSDANADGVEHLGGAVLLGMPNFHSRAFQRVMVGLVEVAGNPNDSFWIRHELMHRTVARLSPEQIEVIAHQLYIEMSKAGYMAVVESHYVHHDLDGHSYADPIELPLRISRAASAAGIGLTPFPALRSHVGFGGQSASEDQRRLINGSEAYLELSQRLRVSLDVIGHSLGLCSRPLCAATPQQIATVLAVGHGDLPVYIHIAEQRKEVDDCLVWSGHQPLQWLCENVAVDRCWCLVHATRVDPGEVAAMVCSGVVAGLCPNIEANLGDGIFSTMGFLAQDGRPGIGSDSHVLLSVVEKLRWLEYGQCLRNRKRDRLYRDDQPTIGRTLYDVTLTGGAQALGQPIGSLAMGRCADLLVLDGNDPYLASVEGDVLLNHWLFAGGDRQVRGVMVAGRWVVRGGWHAGEEHSTRAFVQVLRKLLD